MDPLNPSEFDTPKTIDDDLLAREISIETFDAYTKNPYYSKKWGALLNGTGKYAGFNLSAFVLGGSWCVYRKQYLLGIIVLIASILVTVGFGFLYVFFIDTSPTFQAQKVSIVVGILAMFLFVRLPFAMFINNFYFKVASRDIQKAIDSKLPDKYFLGEVKLVGGVNITGFIFFQGLSVIISKLL